MPGAAFDGHWIGGRLVAMLNAPMSDAEIPDDVSDEEAARRRDEVIKRMLATPPQPRVSPKKKPKAKAP